MNVNNGVEDHELSSVTHQFYRKFNRQFYQQKWTKIPEKFLNEIDSVIDFRKIYEESKVKLPTDSLTFDDNQSNPDKAKKPHDHKKKHQPFVKDIDNDLKKMKQYKKDEVQEIQKKMQKTKQEKGFNKQDFLNKFIREFQGKHDDNNAEFQKNFKMLVSELWDNIYSVFIKNIIKKRKLQCITDPPLHFDNNDKIFEKENQGTGNRESMNIINSIKGKPNFGSFMMRLNSRRNSGVNSGLKSMSSSGHLKNNNTLKVGSCNKNQNSIKKAHSPTITKFRTALSSVNPYGEAPRNIGDSQNHIHEHLRQEAVKNQKVIDNLVDMVTSTTDRNDNTPEIKTSRDQTSSRVFSDKNKNSTLNHKTKKQLADMKKTAAEEMKFLQEQATEFLQDYYRQDQSNRQKTNENPNIVNSYNNLNEKQSADNAQNDNGDKSTNSDEDNVEIDDKITKTIDYSNYIGLNSNSKRDSNKSGYNLLDISEGSKKSSIYLKAQNYAHHNIPLSKYVPIYRKKSSAIGSLSNALQERKKFQGSKATDNTDVDSPIGIFFQ